MDSTTIVNLLTGGAGAAGMWSLITFVFRESFAQLKKVPLLEAEVMELKMKQPEIARMSDALIRLEERVKYLSEQLQRLVDKV